MFELIYSISALCFQAARFMYMLVVGAVYMFACISSVFVVFMMLLHFMGAK